MDDKTLFNTLLSKPETLADISMDKLNEWIKAYPFVSSLHLLKAKKAQISQSPLFPETLEKAAIYAHSRSVLFDWITRQKLKLSIAEVVDEIESIEIPTEEPPEIDLSEYLSEADNTKAEQKEEEEIPIPEIDLSTYPTTVSYTGIDKKEDEKLESLHSSEKEKLSTPNKEDASKKTEATIPADDKTDSTDEPSFSSEDKQVPAESKAAEKPEKDALREELEKQMLAAMMESQSFVQPQISVDKETEDSASTTAEVEKEAKDDTPKSFNAWLRALNEKKAGAIPVKKEPQSKVSKPAETKEKQSQDSKSPQKLKHQLDLIDQYIDRERKGEKPKQPAFTSGKIAPSKASLAEDKAFITETLANIYVKQGNLKKAIQAFEFLQQKYPEKSSYFARQISELKGN